MPELKSTSVLTFVTLALLAGVFARSTHEVRAAEECLSKPGSSAPPGQHWYYRVDHASGRQCWRLGPTGLRVQKSAPAFEKRTASASAKQSVEPAQAQRPGTTGTGSVSTEVASEPNVTSTRPAYWLDAYRLMNQSSSVLPTAEPASSIERPTGSPDLPSPGAEDSATPPRSVVASAGDALPQAVARAEEPQRTAPVPRPAAKPSIVDDDHTFALLLLMFVTLAIAGPMLHFTDRRRRKARGTQTSRWDSAMILNEPDTDVQMPLAPHGGVGGGPEAIPSNVSVHTERLEQALHQLLDRLQKDNLTGQNAAHSAKRVEVELKKSA
jgi:hypothetical protein